MEPITTEATSTLITQFGLAGFVVVTSLGALVYVVKDLLKKSDMKDGQMVSIAKDFTTALKENAQAIQKLNESEIKLADATDEFHKWLKGSAERNERDHKDILDFVKARQAR